MKKHIHSCHSELVSILLPLVAVILACSLNLYAEDPNINIPVTKLYQNDYQDKLDNSKDTIAKSGCSLTALAMLINQALAAQGLHQKNPDGTQGPIISYTPAEINTLLNDYRTKNTNEDGWGLKIGADGKPIGSSTGINMGALLKAVKADTKNRSFEGVGLQQKAHHTPGWCGIPDDIGSEGVTLDENYKYILDELKAGRPVVVLVHYKYKDSEGNEHYSQHYVLIKSFEQAAGQPEGRGRYDIADPWKDEEGNSIEWLDDEHYQNKIYGWKTEVYQKGGIHDPYEVPSDYWIDPEYLYDPDVNPDQYGPQIFESSFPCPLVGDISTVSELISDWQNCMDHWTVSWGDAMLGFSSTGATLNGTALKVVGPAGGWAWALQLKLQNYTHSDYTVWDEGPKDVDIFGYGDQGFVDWFMVSECNSFEMDVTRLVIEWIPDGSPDPYSALKMILNSGGFDANGVWAGVWYDAGDAGSWDPSMGDGPIRLSWDISDAKADTQALFDAGYIYDRYVEICLIPTNGGYIGPVTYYLDNAQLLGATEAYNPDPEVLGWNPADGNKQMFDNPPPTMLAPGDPDGGVLVGDWQNCMDHWTVNWGDAMLGFSSTGAVRNGTALKAVGPAGGWSWAIDVKLQNYIHFDVDIFGYGDNGFVDWFMDSCQYNKFEVDVTRVSGEWIPDGSPDPYSMLKMVLDAGGFNVNGDWAGVWYDAGDAVLPLDSTTRCVWDISDAKADTQALFDAGYIYDRYVEICLIPTNGGYIGPVTYYLDNARLTASPPVCGDGTCNGTETCDTCPQDCGECPPVCGDGTCNGEETCDTCPQDCGPVGDLTDDCKVNWYDVKVMSEEWLNEGIKADIYSDGIVNFRDFALLVDGWLEEEL